LGYMDERPSLSVVHTTAENVEKPGRKPGRLEVPKHGGGLLKRGGTIGPGRPPNAIRQMLRESLINRLDVLEAIADGRAVRRVKVGEDGAEVETWVSPEPGDRIRALDLLAKYGLGTQKEVNLDAEVRHVQISIRREA